MHLKYFIRDYSKYLGLDYEDMIDDFNEFLFDYTSRISLDDIKKARKQVENSKKNQEKRVVSPYTYEKNEDNKSLSIVIYIIIICVISLCLFLIISKMNRSNNKTNTIEENVIR